ncbi:hypothetical protein [Nocardioides kribbensis]|uniref:hypothetical protein n=1 Tax=Nocardioides kribbensis TaxID=305517 RepID=UPI0032DA8FF3
MSVVPPGAALPSTGPRRRARPARPVELARGAWGLLLLGAPRTVLRPMVPGGPAPLAVGVVRVLGARQLAQAALSGSSPSPEVLALGAWVDGVHAATSLGLVGAEPRCARAGLADAAVALVWSGFGLRSLQQAGAALDRPPGLRDALAVAVLSRVPAGAPLLARAREARAA